MPDYGAISTTTCDGDCLCVLFTGAVPVSCLARTLDGHKKRHPDVRLFGKVESLNTAPVPLRQCGMRVQQTTANTKMEFRVWARKPVPKTDDRRKRSSEHRPPAATCRSKYSTAVSSQNIQSASHKQTTTSKISDHTAAPRYRNKDIVVPRLWLRVFRASQTTLQLSHSFFSFCTPSPTKHTRSPPFAPHPASPRLR